nr:molybdopterin-dependent oxidoreductase [Candidatus Formimonas warabiya]
MTWDEAYDTIEKNFRKAIEEYGPESILGYIDTSRGLVWHMGRFIYC